jgi:hypothetical protein
MSEPTQVNRAGTAEDELDIRPADREIPIEERQVAAATWLLAAADDREIAQREWRFGDLALLRCGALFTAIRVPLSLMEAAAGTDDRQKIGAYLNEALIGGAAFLDTTSQQVYFLVPPSTWGRWSVPDTECLCPDMYLGVPRPGAEPKERSYWLVEMDGPGLLCMTNALKQVVQYGRLRTVQDDE